MKMKRWGDGVMGWWGEGGKGEREEKMRTSNIEH